MKQKEKEIIQQRKQHVADRIYGNVCAGCTKKYRKGFGFHHLEYREDELTHRDFKNTFEYQNYILPIIESRPLDFKLLCNKCHYVIENWKRYNSEKFERLVEIVRATK